MVLVLFIASLFAVAEQASAKINLNDITLDKQPMKMAVNAVTNKIYVVNSNHDSVTIIDGKNGNMTEVLVGQAPGYVAVNSITNKIYVTNRNSTDVTVIDGKNNETTTIAMPNGGEPTAIAVNEKTNKVYVVSPGISNQGGNGEDGTYIKNSGSIIIIDGASNKTNTILTKSEPVLLAVNEKTNKVYVTNSDIVYNAAGDFVKGTGKVTVIDGVSNKMTSVNVGRGPMAIAVNPVTNKIYVANCDSRSVTVIDGASNKTTTVKAGSTPIGVSVNPVTNKIYVINTYSDNVTVIDGKSNKTTTVNVGHRPHTLVVNPAANKTYVLNGNHYKANKSIVDLTVIDGANKTTTVVVKATTSHIAVNPVTNKVYVSLPTNNIVTVIDDGAQPKR